MPTMTPKQGVVGEAEPRGAGGQPPYCEGMGNASLQQPGAVAAREMLRAAAPKAAPGAGLGVPTEEAWPSIRWWSTREGGGNARTDGVQHPRYVSRGLRTSTSFTLATSKSSYFK